MEAYKISNLSYKYPYEDGYALENISLEINEGDFIVICGLSGSGKSTLLRFLKKQLIPQGGIASGSILYYGRDIGGEPDYRQAADIGFVMQNPDEQIVCDKVWHELAFLLESLGRSRGEIGARLAEISAYFGLEEDFNRDCSTLSGGRKQRLCLAAALTGEPGTLILDEPVSQLDPIAAEELISLISKLNRDFGMTVIMAEHELNGVYSIADRLIALDNGGIIADGPPAHTASELLRLNNPLYEAMPAAVRIYNACGGSDVPPASVKEARQWLGAEASAAAVEIATVQSKSDKRAGKTAVSFEEVHFRYSREQEEVLKGLSLEVKEGEFLALLGGNGAGKSTLLALAAGLDKPQRGSIALNGKRVGYLPQNPISLMLGSTVADGLSGASKQALDEAVSVCGLEGLMDRSPFDLSGGELQRAAFARIMITGAQVFLLDEPTKGLDNICKARLAAMLSSLCNKGITVIMASHDLEFCAEYADRCAMLFNGRIETCVNAAEFFLNNRFYTTAACKISRGIIPNTVTAGDVISALGRSAPIMEAPKKRNASGTLTDENSNLTSFEEEIKHGGRAAFIAAYAVSALAVILTLIAGVYLLGDRKYYIVSMLIMLEMIAPAFIMFERKRPKAAELTSLAVICALCALGRAAFFMVPQIKPMGALIMISAAALGCGRGFIVGALGAFISNFFFGHGPWTPWQMTAFGLMGFLFALATKLPAVKEKPAAAAACGAFITIAVYGGIMNASSVLSYQSSPTLGMFITSYAMGLPFDIIHAASSAVFLLLLYRPVLERLERIRMKYGF